MHFLLKFTFLQSCPDCCTLPPQQHPSGCKKSGGVSEIQGLQWDVSEKEPNKERHTINNQDKLVFKAVPMHICIEHNISQSNTFHL